MRYYTEMTESELNSLHHNDSLIRTLFSWFIGIPVFIGMYAFGLMACAMVLIAFAPFWVLSVIMGMFRGEK